MSGHPDPKTFERRVVRIAELVADDAILDGYTFTECQIKGPAVLILTGSGTLSNSSLGPDADAVLWEIPLTRPRVIGAIEVRDCTFSHCEFQNVGFAGPPEVIRRFRSQIG